MNRQGAHRRMNQMNGDYLTQLKKPLRSEMNRHVIGTNKAVATLMNKRLDLFFKDQNIALEKIRRRQEAVYNTMLRVHKEKKILQRATHKRRQEEGWQELNKAKAVTAKADVLRVEPIPEDGGGKPTSAKDNARDSSPEVKVDSVVADGTTTTQSGEEWPRPDFRPTERIYERKAKVLEVSKRSPLAPITRERSDVGKAQEVNEARSSVSLPGKDHSALPNVRRELVPDIKSPVKGEPSAFKERSITELAIESVAIAQNTTDPVTPASKVNAADPSYRSSQNSPKGLSKSTVAMPTISEAGRNRHLPPLRRSADDVCPSTTVTKTTSRNDADGTTSAAPSSPAATTTQEATSNKNGASSDDNSSGEKNRQPKKQLSLAEYNKRRAMAKLRRCHQELQNEPLVVYVKDANGNYVPSNTEFKRRQFVPPSFKEKYLQKKMLRAQLEARLEQRRKLEAFFERMAEKERERERIREAFKRKAIEEAEQIRQKLKEQSEKLGFSPSQLVSLFSKGILPEGMDPSSFEAIRYCKYIRLYPLNYNDMNDGETSEEDKGRSWSAAKLSS